MPFEPHNSSSSSEYNPDPNFGLDLASRPRTAVFGGTFDPIHIGHLFVAGEVIRRELATEVLFVPAGTPPHKNDAVSASAEHRLAMVSAAIEGFGEFSISDIEINRKEGYSYTYDTMTLLNRVFPDHDLVFLLGMDSLNELHTWHRATELVSHFDVITYPRGNVLPPAFTRLAERFGGHKAARLLNAVMDCEPLPISSTRVRGLVADKLNPAGLLPASVISYIRSHRLYRPIISEPTDENEFGGEAPAPENN
ncbi:MAG: nicotinate-nucleotide adenylyltransferase [Verrucomicrobiota bacterium]